MNCSRCGKYDCSFLECIYCNGSITKCHNKGKSVCAKCNIIIEELRKMSKEDIIIKYIRLHHFYYDVKGLMYDKNF